MNKKKAREWWVVTGSFMGSMVCCSKKEARRDARHIRKTLDGQAEIVHVKEVLKPRRGKK